MVAKTMTGARAQVIVDNPNTGKSSTIGIYSRISYGVAFGVQSVDILGRFSPDELVYTHYEPVNITASGYKVVDHGAHADAGFPKLSDLLNFQDLTLAVFDRQTKKRVGTIRNVKPATYDIDYTAKDLSQYTMRYVGILVDDESVENAESVGASSLP
jgi:hypothetical protein